MCSAHQAGNVGTYLWLAVQTEYSTIGILVQALWAQHTATLCYCVLLVLPNWKNLSFCCQFYQRLQVLQQVRSRHSTFAS